jgi:hypothetical protein
MPVWMTQSLIPSAEFTYWKAWLALKWSEMDKDSYQWAMTRQVIAGSLGGSRKSIEDCSFEKLMKDAPIPWEWMSEEQQAEYMEQSKSVWRTGSR